MPTFLIKNIMAKWFYRWFWDRFYHRTVFKSNFYSILKTKLSPIWQTKCPLKNTFLIVIVISYYPRIFKLFGIKVQCAWRVIRSLFFSSGKLSAIPSVYTLIWNMFFLSCADKSFPWILVYKTQWFLFIDTDRIKTWVRGNWLLFYMTTYKNSSSTGLLGILFGILLSFYKYFPVFSPWPFSGGISHSQTPTISNLTGLSEYPIGFSNSHW